MGAAAQGSIGILSVSFAETRLIAGFEVLVLNGYWVEGKKAVINRRRTAYLLE